MCAVRRGPTHSSPRRLRMNGQESDSVQAKFLEHLPTVREAISSVCRRYKVPPDDRADFAASVLVKLIDNDYAVFRRFRGDSQMRTFVYVVAANFLADQRNRAWGKWRP